MKRVAKHAVLTTITAISLAIVAIVMVLLLAQNRSLTSRQIQLSEEIKKLADQNQRNGIAVVNYLDCVGHIPKPVPQRTIADYDKCLDNMRATVKGNK